MNYELRITNYELKNARRSSLVTRHLPLALTLLAFLLRAYKLDAQSYWIDEIWSVYFARLSPAEMWQILRTTEVMPPLYHPSTIYYIRLFGDSEYALRFYSLIFGVMAVPFSYRLGKDLGDDRLGLIASLLMAIAPFQIWHSQDVRMYGMLMAAATMSMWGFVNVWRRGGWRWWLVYMLGTLWAFNTHYHSTLLIGIQGLFLLLTWRRHWRGYLHWGAALLLLLLGMLPWLLYAGNRLQGYFSWIEATTLWQIFQRSAIAYSLNTLLPLSLARWLALPFVAAYLLGLVYATRRRWGPWRGPEMLAFLLSYTVAPLIAAWIYGLLRSPVFLERYLMLVQVGYLLTVSAGLLGVADLRITKYTPRILGSRFNPYAGRLLAALLLALLVGINGWVLHKYYADPVYARPDWRGVARTVATFELPGDATLLTGDGGEHAFNYYYHGNMPVRHDFNLLPPTHPDYKKGRPNGPDKIPEIMQEMAGNYRRLWLTPYGVEADKIIELWLRENSFPAWQSWIGRKQLALYHLQPNLDEPQPVNARFAGPGDIELTGIARPTTPTAGGDTLPLELTWLAHAPLPADVQLSLRLLNPQGDTFAQSDWPPLPPAAEWQPEQPLTDRRALWLPADVPPGDYLLQFVVYNPATGQPLGQPFTLPGITVTAAQISPPPEALAIPNLTKSQIANRKSQMIGFAHPESLQPGQPLWLWLYWQATGPVPPDAALSVSLTSGAESVAAEWPLAGVFGPPDDWQPGQVRRGVIHLPTSPRLQRDTAQLAVSLREPDAPPVEFPLGDIALQTRERNFQPPPLAAPLDVTFGQPEKIALLGHKLDSDNSHLTLFWRAEAEMDTNYTVFAQLLNPEGQVVTQADAQPQHGAAPTTTWLPGEIIADDISLTLPPGLPPGRYRLIAGLYDAASGARLPVSGGGDFVELQQVTLE